MPIFNLGYNFDPELIEVINDLNEYYGDSNRITSVYGSDQEHAWLAARPDFRLPQVPAGDLRMHVRDLLDIGVEFNYTANSPTFGSKAEFVARQDEVLAWMDELENMGVARIIVANPMLLELMANKRPQSNLNFELSTIMHIDTPMQILAFQQRYPNIDKVVGNILYNRNFPKLTVFNRVCRQASISYEVMVNEFCVITSGTGEPLAAHCIFRDSCYNCHATNVTKKDATAMRNYPMGKCMASRAYQTADWLRAFFVRPQDLDYYGKASNQTAFKITGRTAKTPYIKKIAEAYMSGVFNDNLLELWKPLQTIYSDKDELSEHKHQIEIPAAKLDGFVGGFHTRDCSSLLCSECRYCDDWAASLSEGGVYSSEEFQVVPIGVEGRVK